MKRDLRSEIRALLRRKSDGLIISQIIAELNSTDKSVRHAVKSMPDVYVDRWTFPRIGPMAAVYCAVEVPEDAPRPSQTKRTEEELKEYHRRKTSEWHAARKRGEPTATELANMVHKPQGLTTIRGPWPT